MVVVELAIQRYIGLHRMKPWQGSFIRWRDCWRGRIFRNGGFIYRSNGGEGEAVKSGSYCRSCMFVGLLISTITFYII